MKNEPDPKIASQILKNCAAQLRKASDELDHETTSVTALTKIDGAARALESLSDQLIRVLEQYRRTVGGLTDEVHRLKTENMALSSRAIDIL